MDETHTSGLAMQDAVTKAARLHRDISIGNIILVREGERASRTGYLIDWDASCDVDESGEATEAGRAVRFISCTLKYLR